MISLSILAALTAVTSDPTTPAATVAPTVEASVPVERASPKARRFCIKSIPTGTRIQRMECHTRAEWEDRGVDLFAK